MWPVTRMSRSQCGQSKVTVRQSRGRGGGDARGASAHMPCGPRWDQILFSDGKWWKRFRTVVI